MPYPKNTRRRMSLTQGRPRYGSTSASPHRAKPRGKTRRNSKKETQYPMELRKCLWRLKKEPCNFELAQECLESLKKEEIRVDAKFGAAYLGTLKNHVSGGVDSADEFLQHLIDAQILCDSKLFLEYIYIQRNHQKMKDSTQLSNLIKQLNIHRPSFKMLASIITTYCTLSLKAFKEKNMELSRTYTLSCKDFYSIMKKKYKYVPNTYLLNTVLNLYCKVDEQDEFWDLVIETCGEKNIPFDAFTYGSIMEQCLKEKNYVKMKDVYNNFKSNLGRFADDKNINYVNSLMIKMRALEKKQRKQFFTDPEWGRVLLSSRNV